jgi:hypothetical protein
MKKRTHLFYEHKKLGAKFYASIENTEKFSNCVVLGNVSGLTDLLSYYN